MGNSNIPSWEANSELILKKLREHDAILSKLTDLLTQVMVSQGKLEVKSGIWGIIGGVLTIALAIGIYFIKTKTF